MEATSRAGNDRESRDLQLEYHAIAIAEEASQKFVPSESTEFGTQARIELTDLSGKSSDRCLYLQLRPALIYQSVSTSRDGESVYEFGSKVRIDEWRRSESPVMLVQRSNDGYIRWMNITAWLRENWDGQTAIELLAFDGEPFTALNLHRLRERLFS